MKGDGKKPPFTCHDCGPKCCNSDDDCPNSVSFFRGHDIWGSGTDAEPLAAPACVSRGVLCACHLPHNQLPHPRMTRHRVLMLENPDHYHNYLISSVILCLQSLPALSVLHDRPH